MFVHAAAALKGQFPAVLDPSGQGFRRRHQFAKTQQDGPNSLPDALTHEREAKKKGGRPHTLHLRSNTVLQREMKEGGRKEEKKKIPKGDHFHDCCCLAS